MFDRDSVLVKPTSVYDFCSIFRFTYQSHFLHPSTHLSFTCSVIVQLESGDVTVPVKQVPRFSPTSHSRLMCWLYESESDATNLLFQRAELDTRAELAARAERDERAALDARAERDARAKLVARTERDAHAELVARSELVARQP